MTLARRVITGATPVILVLAIATLGLVLQPEGGDRPITARLAGGPPNALPFTISGSVTGLYPGAHRPLTIVIQNNALYAENVTSISATVGSSDHVGCGAANVSVSSFAGSLVVPATSARTMVLTASMIPSPPNACQGATFPLTYNGMAVRTPLPPTITPDPIILKLIGLRAKLTLGQFNARMTVSGTTDPIVGKTLVFSIGGQVACQAVTASDGWARCGGLFDSVAATLRLSYQVNFAGDSGYEPASGTGQLLVVLL